MLCRVAACLALPIALWGSTYVANSREGMLRELDFLGNVFETRYAPAEWKKHYSQWDLTTELAQAKATVTSSQTFTVKDYQRVLQRLCNSTGDHHVGVAFYSTEAALLPFEVASAEGKIFITEIDRDRLPYRSYPFEVGDELVLFDGSPIAEVLRELAADELANTGSATECALAEILLTYRRGVYGNNVPQGPICITVKSRKTGGLATYQLVWEYAPETVRNPSICTLSPMRPQHAGPPSGCLLDHPFFHKQMATPLWASYAPKNSRLSIHPNALGTRESFIPELGRIVWRSDDDCPFHAYIFKHPDTQRSIGYIRIPHYSGGEDEVEQFGACISYLERKSEALIVDQVNNPGGNAFYLYALASMLTDQPLMAPRHRLSLTQADVTFFMLAQDELERVQSDGEAKELLGDFWCGYPVDCRFARSLLEFFRFCVGEWNAGRRLTPPCYLYGVDWIQPHATVRYTKPILMLVNRLDFSGGDFLPAILQDHGRATLFGERTAGAGGAVEGFSYPNLYGVDNIHYTCSIAERLQGNPIENLGVTPDVPYSLTRKDLEQGYSGYVRAVLNSVSQRLK